MTTRRSRRLRVAVAALCAAFGVSCSGGDADGEPDAAADATSSPSGPTDTATTSGAGSGTEPAGDPATATTTPATTATTTTITTPTVPEAFLAGVEPMVVRSPGGADAGPMPEFAWEPVDGAAGYRLVVIDPAGPVWSWEGTETSVWLGGFTVEPPPGAIGLAIVDGSCWSVVARDADDAVVAASAVMPIAPTGAPTHTCSTG